MSPLTEPSKLVLAKSYVGVDDPDAAAYIAAVETADKQSLETAVKVAIHSFIKGCKADGIWPAIKASCILAGARTLTGALVPLVGPAPTNVNFVSGDYNRKTGLVGDGSTKRLSAGISYLGARGNGTLHHSAFVSVAGSTNRNILGINAEYVLNYSSSNTYSSRLGGAASKTGSVATGFVGATSDSNYTTAIRFDGTTVIGNAIVVTPPSSAIGVFARGTSVSANQRLAFYSIGESLDLAKLDARVTDLINAFGAAIP